MTKWVRIKRAPSIEGRHRVDVGSVFCVIERPTEFNPLKSVKGDVWIMGHAGEPVRLFSREYDFCGAPEGQS